MQAHCVKNSVEDQIRDKFKIIIIFQQIFAFKRISKFWLVTISFSSFSFKNSLDSKLPCPSGECFVNFQPLTTPAVFSINRWGFSSSLCSDQDIIITINNPCQLQQRLERKYDVCVLMIQGRWKQSVSMLYERRSIQMLKCIQYVRL